MPDKWQSRMFIARKIWNNWQDYDENSRCLMRLRMPAGLNLFKLYFKIFQNCDNSNALSFYVTKTILVGPKWFWSYQIDLDLTIMIWSWPKWNGHDQNELVRSKSWFCTKMNHIWTWPIHFGRDRFILVVTKSLWSSPNQFGQVQINLVRPKPFWTDQNCFGHIEGQGINHKMRCNCYVLFK